MTVYVLQHMYEDGENNGHEEVKFIGVFSSLEQAKNAKEKLFSLPGFKDYPSDSFYIDPYEVDELHWQEGFVDGKRLTE